MQRVQTDISLPEEFFDLYRLKELDLSYNRFRSLPACLCTLLDLEKIDISGFRFAVFPLSFELPPVVPFPVNGGNPIHVSFSHLVRGNSAV